MNTHPDAFGACIAAAVIAPNDCDTGLLAQRADELLRDIIPGNPGPPEIIESAARLAHAALDFAIAHSPDDYCRLVVAARSFEMIANLIH